VRRHESRAGWLFVAPAALHLAVFALAPVGYALWVSLFDWKILKGEMPFVGLGQYARVLTDGAFFNALWNSFRFALMSVPTGMALALGVALLVAQPLRGMAFFRMLFYVPAIGSAVAVSMLWIYVYLPEFGLINATTALFGFGSVDFLNEPWWAMGALAFMSVWTGLGPKMVVYVAGLMAIPPALQEAAALDGAGPWRRFWNVTLPQLAPTNLFVLITSTIAAFQLFTPVYMMTKGGPLDSTDVVGYHVYTTAWQRSRRHRRSRSSFWW
jgi:multiple sugar transport system permease protein